MARYLYQGCEPGFDVMELQDGLNNARAAVGEGSAQGTLSVDGIFGGRTGARVLEFQRMHQLTADAVVGPHTWSALESVLVTIPGLQVRRPMGGGGNPGASQGPQGAVYGKPAPPPAPSGSPKDVPQTGPMGAALGGPPGGAGPGKLTGGSGWKESPGGSGKGMGGGGGGKGF